MFSPHDLALRSSFSGYDYTPRVRVMLFDPNGGIYPRGTFFCDDGFFYAGEDLVFSAIRCSGWRAISDDVPFSEFAWASPSQVRMLGALLFCQTLEGPWVRLYPVIRQELVLEPSALNLTDPGTVGVIKMRLLVSANEAPDLPHALRVPGWLLQHPYSLLEESELNMERFAPSYRAIEPGNFVLLRGIQSLVKCDMLTRHQEFGEESVIAAFIALDASFTLVQRKLKTEGNSKPSAHDAAKWLHRHLYEPYGHDPPDELEKYFEEFYDSRISTLHPGNRFGDYPFSPTMWDDALHLRSVLRQVFSLLVHCEH